TGFFPLVVAIPLVILALTDLLFEYLGISEKATGPAVETEFSNEVPPEVARRRVVAMFSWIAGFIVAVYLVGFPAAIPPFIFLYLKVQSQVNWLRSIALTATAWGFFHVVFQRIVQLQFESGVIQSWMGL
ncbi:MAG TPA: tripartite tricarboxylate transporter TctB family protein, partial [Candidatus Udaeobacter sp.]|nr:tripartite tricarboxylate transporter TctB family protein [Candidatus Udaeobacter sp.]